MAGGDHDAAPANAPAQAGGARRAAFGHLRRLLRIAQQPRWATPVLIGLGLATSLAETLGITLVIVFLYAAMGQPDAAAAVGGLLGQALAQARGIGSPALLAGGIGVLIVARAALSYANRVINGNVGERINETSRNLIHEQYLRVSYGFVQRQDQARLMEVLGTESWLIASAYNSLTRILIGACSLVVFVAFLLALSWQITLTALVGSALLSLGLRRLSRPAHALGQRVKQVHQDLGVHMLISLEGLRTIRAYGQEQAHHERFLRSSAEARQTAQALTRLSAVLDPLTEVGYLIVLCAIVAGAAWWSTSFATTLAAVALLYRMQPHARDIEGQLLYLAQIEPQLRSLRAMLEKDDKAYDAPGQVAVPVPALRRAIRFDAVSLRYDADAAPALNAVSFEIAAGATTALVGASGAGKTTVINLLLRLYTPSAGRILVDDVPLDELRRTEWLSRLAVAGQDIDLIEGTVSDNIRIADPTASHDDVVAACQLAGAHEFIAPLAAGYDTRIGQQGLRFSGGQRQRLGLARALLRDPEFLILDEAMSALDSELEHRVRSAIQQRFAGRTLLIISHRAQTVLDADHVIRLEQGVVVQPT
jgi:ABC-type multidrug transport system fused ATPase/permease subunit